jgi:ubiquitin-like protein ATG12
METGGTLSPGPKDEVESPFPVASPTLEDEADSPELPLTMTASAVLADLPRDATAALASAGAFAQEKVVVRFKPVGSAPGLAQDVCKISSTRKFEEVVRYLRKKLQCNDTDSVFLYVNSAFAPSLDEVVGNLHQCFKNANDQLVVAYSMTPAFG